MPLFETSLHSIDTEKVRAYAAQRGQDHLNSSLVDECCQTVLELAVPKGVFQQGYYDKDSQHILCSVPFKLKSQQLTSYIAQSPILLMAAVTIGPLVEQEIDKRFLAHHIPGGIVLDSAAAVAAGQLLDELTDHINELTAPKGYRVLWRLSPGTGDWPVSQQVDLASAAGGSRIGLSVTAGGMLTPRKTATALFGLQQSGESCGGSCSGCAMAGHCGI